MNRAINDTSGKPTGFTSTDQNNLKKTIMDSSYRPLGFYDVKADKTFDASGRPIGEGDQTMRLLPPNS